MINPGGQSPVGIPGGMELDPTTIDNEKCACGCEVWDHGIVLKKISGLMNPSGKDQLGTLPVIVCKKCLAPHSSALPILKDKG